MQDYAAATALRSGFPIYGDSIQQIIDQTVPGNWHIANNHPPSTALLFLPFSVLPYPIAFVALNILSLLIVTAMVVASFRNIPINPKLLPLALGFCFCWYPVIYCLGTGQSSVLIAGCITFGWLSLKRGGQRSAGVLFGIAALFKLFPGIIALYLIAQRRFTSLSWMISAFTLGVFLSVLIGGVEPWSEYVHQIIASDMEQWNAFVLNVSICGFIERLIGAKTAWVEPLVELPLIARTLQLIVQAGLIMWLAATLNKIKGDQGVGFSLTTVLMLLISPIMWAHMFPVLIYPVLLLIALQTGPKKRNDLIAVLLIVALLSIPDVLLARFLMSFYLPNHMPWYTALLLTGQTIGLLLLLCKFSAASRDSLEIV